MTRSLLRHIRFVAACVCAIALVGLTTIGCAPEGPVVFPVHGQLLLEGRPLAEAMVVLHPLSGEVPGGQKPLAHTGEDGRFALTTYRSGDGAPPGEYAITVELRAPRTIGEEVVRDGRNLLPARYSRSASSGLRCTVTETENGLAAIEVKKR